MKDAFLLSDTVPPAILKEAFHAAGFRLRGYRLVCPSIFSLLKHQNIVSSIFSALVYLTQRIHFRIINSSHCTLFFYTASESEDGILQTIFNIKKVLKLSKAPLHVSELSRNYCFRRKRFFAVGAPGSGNMIFLRISDEILKLRESSRLTLDDDPIGDFLKKQALFYMSFVKSRLQEALKPHYVSDAIGPEGFGRCYFSGNIRKLQSSKVKGFVENGGIFVTALPLNHQAWANPLHTCHQGLLSSDLHMFKKNNTDVIHVIRHPLDNLLSITSKIAFSLASSPSPKYREVWIKRLLNTEPWFITLLEAICRYYENVLKKKNLIKFINYEDLFINPQKAVQKMAGHLQETVPEKIAHKMWSSLANEQLTVHAGHRWKPGCEKWKRYVPRKYQGILMRSNLQDICRAFDYESPNFSDLPYLKGVPIPRRSTERLALKDLHYYFLIRKQPYFKHPNITIYKDPLSKVEIGGFDEQVQAVSKLIKSGNLF